MGLLLFQGPQPGSQLSEPVEEGEEGVLACLHLTSEPTPRCHMFNRTAIPSSVTLFTGGFSWRVVTASTVTKCLEQICGGNLTLFSGSKSREKSGSRHDLVIGTSVASVLHFEW